MVFDDIPLMMVFINTYATTSGSPSRRILWTLALRPAVTGESNHSLTPTENLWSPSIISVCPYSVDASPPTFWFDWMFLFIFSIPWVLIDISSITCLSINRFSAVVVDVLIISDMFNVPSLGLVNNAIRQPWAHSWASLWIRCGYNAI